MAAFTTTETRLVRLTVAQAAVTRARMMMAARESAKVARRYAQHDELIRRMFADHATTCLNTVGAIDAAFAGIFCDTDDTGDTDTGGDWGEERGELCAECGGSHDVRDHIYGGQS